VEIQSPIAMSSATPLHREDSSDKDYDDAEVLLEDPRANVREVIPTRT
jgi:hypothetical protein